MKATFKICSTISLFLIFSSTVFFYYGCKSDEEVAATCSDGIQNQGETGIDCGGPCDFCPTCFDGIQNQGETGIDCGGPCAACPSCTDGIMNQGETGIDCGGPCPACPFVCTGNGEDKYFPLVLNNMWSYNSTGEDFTWTVTGTTTINSQTYQVVTVQSATTSSEDYYRIQNNDIYKYDPVSGQEFLEVPSNPVVNQPWPAPDFGTKKVVSLTASVTTDQCFYTNCMQIQSNTSIGTISATFYYVKGIGVVRSFYASSGMTADLSSLVLN